MPENLVTLTYSSTHYFLLELTQGKLLLDAGMPGSLPAFKAQCKKYSVALPEIRWVMCTHTHPDHAGILQEVKQAAGAKLILLETQVPFLAEMRQYYKQGGAPLQLDPGDRLLRGDTRPFLRSIGIQGEIVATPGHSPDSLSLVLDSGAAFVGDLNPLIALDPDNGALTLASWKKLVDLNAQVFYPSHADPFPLSRLKTMLM